MISSSATKKVVEDLVYDMDSGKMMSREEYNKCQAAKDDLEGINEEDDYEDDEEEGDIKGT
jgi:hypothetical protein